MIARIDPQRPASGAQASAPAPIANAMSIDVEDWFQVAAFDRHIDRSQWDSLECRVERNLERILALLDRYDAKATFFTLGWIAERYPAIIRAIVAGSPATATATSGSAISRPKAFGKT